MISDQFTSFFHAWRSVLLLAIAIGTSGCGPKPVQSYAVNGGVRMGESPVDSGVVRFVPTATDEGPARSAISVPIRGGRYSILSGGGLHAGPYRVEVEVHVKTGRKTSGRNELGEMDQVDEVTVVSSEQYAGPQSPLTFLAGPNQSNVFDIDVPRSNDVVEPRR